MKTHSAPSYKSAGVDIAQAEKLKHGLSTRLLKTRRPEVLGTVGGFGGLFELNLKKYRRPVMVSSVDGVGTKLKVAVAMNRHDTIGQDLVNHCVNDIAVLGAEPLYFLDYIGLGKLTSRVFQQLIGGMAKACQEAHCALIGGETAQMPDMYRNGEYDLVGSIVGIVDKAKILDGKQIKPGNVIVGLASTGLHTNGYTLARQILLVRMRALYEDYHSDLGCTIGQEFLKVHRNYHPLIKAALDKSRRVDTKKNLPLRGIAHITGGGFYDNIPRILPENCKAVIRDGSWDVLPIFKLLQQQGEVSNEEMHRVFNMGIGMIFIVDSKFVSQVEKLAQKFDIASYVIGEVHKGKREVQIE